jgi:hypothetical protein
MRFCDFYTQILHFYTYHFLAMYLPSGFYLVAIYVPSACQGLAMSLPPGFNLVARDLPYACHVLATWIPPGFELCPTLIQLGLQMYK